MNEREYLDNVLTELENNLTNEEDETMTETTTINNVIIENASIYELLEAMTAIVKDKVSAYASDFAYNCYRLGHADGTKHDSDVTRYFWLVRECGTWLVDYESDGASERIADYRERYDIRTEYDISINAFSGACTLSLIEDTYPVKDNKRTYEIAKFASRSVVAYEVDGKLTKYVVCSDYDASKPVGDQWVSGHYYELWSFGNDASMTLRRTMFDLYGIPYSSDMTPSRMCELMTLFKDALISEDREEYDVTTSEGYDEFKEAFDLEDDEMSYLGIDNPQLYEVVEVEVAITRTYKVNVVMPYGGTNQYELMDVIENLDIDLDDYDDEDTDISDRNVEDEALTAEKVRNNWGYDVANIDDLDD